jgi:hypothetical protein
MTGKMIVESGSVDNLLAWYRRATPEQVAAGRAWYGAAHDICESITRETGIDTRIVAAVVSALSPRNKWNRNLVDARNLCHAYVRGWRPEDVTVCTFNTNRAKAWRFLEQHAWTNGPKTTAFVDNIYHPTTSTRVTVDVWAVRAYCNDLSTDAAITPKQYATIEAAYIEAATIVGIRPMDLQAIVWTVVREHEKGE